MLLNLMQIAVFVLGLRSLYAALKHAHFFLHSKAKIGGSMVRMLAEQCVSSLGTLIFSTNSMVVMFLGEDRALWNTIDPYFAISIRVLMFSAMIHSTNHLSASVRHIIEQGQNNVN